MLNTVRLPGRNDNEEKICIYDPMRWRAFLKKKGSPWEVTSKAYGYRRGENYVYVNREARMGRTALIIHPTLKDRSLSFAEPASDIKTCDHYQQFPLYLGGETHEHYGIPHGFSSRMALERFLKGLFGDVQ